MVIQKRAITKSTEKQQGNIPQYDLAGARLEDISVPREIFKLNISPALLAQYIRVHQTNQRQGNAATKTRAEVAGTTKKIYKQKGTGKARHGSQRAPIFKGGGVVGGPQPKEYRLEMSKKQKKLALFRSLSLKFKDKALSCLTTDMKKISKKTKVISNFLKVMKYGNMKVLFVLPRTNSEYISLIARNLKNALSLPVHSLNAYKVLNASKIIFFGDAIRELENHFVIKHEN